MDIRKLWKKFYELYEDWVYDNTEGDLYEYFIVKQEWKELERSKELELYESWFEECKDWSEEQQKELFFNIIQYGMYGEEIESDNKKINAKAEEIKKKIRWKA